VAKIRIAKRLDAMIDGHFGDHKMIAENLFELRMFYGPGYRAYFTIKGEVIILLLSGGDKKSQADDIRKAKTLLNGLEDDDET
jgi:putative addiction module killer protein